MNPVNLLSNWTAPNFASMNSCCIYHFLKSYHFCFDFSTSSLLCCEFDWLHLRKRKERNQPVNSVLWKGINQAKETLTNQSFSNKIQFRFCPINLSCVYLYIFGTSYGFVLWNFYFPFLSLYSIFFNYQLYFHFSKNIFISYCSVFVFTSQSFCNTWSFNCQSKMSQSFWNETILRTNSAESSRISWSTGSRIWN